jgi:toxin ParE1/3/4
MKQAVITSLAQANLDDIADYIAENNPERAITFIREIVEHCHEMASLPGVGRGRPELGPGIRSLPHGQYVIFYRIIDTGVEILHVIHGARDVEALF